MAVDARELELERIYRTHLTSFTRVAVAVTGELDLAADAVHDAFAGCLRNVTSFRGEGSLEAWVWAAVVNSARRIRRGRRLEPSLPADASAEGNADDELTRVRAAVAALPERQRLVLFLRYYADLDYRTIADTLGIAVGTVGAALNAGHAAIRAHLSEEVIR